MLWVFIAVCGLLIVLASLAVERGAESTRASIVAAHGLSGCGARLSCSLACGSFPDQELNPCPLQWQVDSEPLGTTREVLSVLL